MDEQQELKRLRLTVDRGKLVQGMQMSEGWKLLETEIHKMLDAFKDTGVSTKYLNDPVGHAALIGGYNALKSLLDLLAGARDSGLKAEVKLEQTEKDQRDRNKAERQLRRI